MKNNLALTIFLAAAAYALAQEFEITRHTIDSGGAMRSTGGDFELSGTIGQPDAGVLTGGDLQLTGGFWFALTPTDCNEDGAADLLDHYAFTECLAGPDAPVPEGCECFDTDRSGTLDMQDFAVVQAQYFAP